jgi:putative transposase
MRNAYGTSPVPYFILRGRDSGNTILLPDHLAAVTTNTDKALIVTGRGIRSLKRQRNRQLGQIARKHSRRWKKLQRTKNKQCRRAERRIRDLRHKATRQVINFCVENEVGTLFIGDPHGVHNRDNGRHHNQRMALWEYGKDMDYLTHKSKQAHIMSFTGSERGTSSQCPGAPKEARNFLPRESVASLRQRE